MTSFVLIPGGEARYWHRVTPLLRAAGHDAIAVELVAARLAAAGIVLLNAMIPEPGETGTPFGQAWPLRPEPAGVIMGR